MRQGGLLRNLAQNRVGYSELPAETSKKAVIHRVGCSETSAQNPLTCANAKQGGEGVVIRTFSYIRTPTRAHTHTVQVAQVSDHPALPALSDLGGRR
jgi:hypothetical protein